MYRGQMVDKLGPWPMLWRLIAFALGSSGLAIVAVASPASAPCAPTGINGTCSPNLDLDLDLDLSCHYGRRSFKFVVRQVP